MLQGSMATEGSRSFHAHISGSENRMISLEPVMRSVSNLVLRDLLLLATPLWYLHRIPPGDHMPKLWACGEHSWLKQKQLKRQRRHWQWNKSHLTARLTLVMHPGLTPLCQRSLWNGKNDCWNPQGLSITVFCYPVWWSGVCLAACYKPGVMIALRRGT